jgi:CO/xanthine dehydrogenase FAD-binding subunit
MAVSTPRSLTAALEALAEHPDALVLCGGTDAVVEINAGHRRPEHVVAVDRVPELRTWRHDVAAGVVHIGAGVPYHELMAAELAALVPALAQASRTIGSPQIRQVGTLGGNLGTCSPAGDALPVLAALEADVQLASAGGRRSLPFAAFMTGVKRNARQPGELITGVTLPVLAGWQGYSKVGVRNAMVIATASSCLAVHRPARSVRLALGSVGPVIIRATEAETWVAGEVDWGGLSVSDSVVSEFGARCAAASRPIDDHRSTAAYRRQAVGVLARRQLRRAFPNG